MFCCKKNDEISTDDIVLEPSQVINDNEKLKADKLVGA